jgi:hypothetical protein
MATRKTSRSTSRSRSAATAKRRTATRRRTTSSALQPRRRASRPGLPTTVGAALGTLIVTTLLDLPWPLRVGLIVLVLIVGLAYVVWRQQAATAGASAGAGADADADATDPAPPSAGQ